MENMRFFQSRPCLVTHPLAHFRPFCANLVPHSGLLFLDSLLTESSEGGRQNAERHGGGDTQRGDGEPVRRRRRQHNMMRGMPRGWTARMTDGRDGRQAPTGQTGAVEPETRSVLRMGPGMRGEGCGRGAATANRAAGWGREG